MKLIILLGILFLAFQVGAQNTFTIAIHGGAGVMSRASISETEQQEYLAKLNQALDKGYLMLQNGATAIDVVTEVVKIMEDSPLFNAGKGAVFTSEGIVELDASVMDGSTMNAGAITGVRDVKNPIEAARAVMEKSEHVMLCGKGASEFAAEQGLQIVDNSYFHTSKRLKSLKLLQKQEREKSASDNIGTVGCVVLDKYGNLCAGTSTGGMTNKKYGRIGDAAIIGAGNFAKNKVCAVSCTGHGEYYIRLGFARDIAALMEYKNMDVKAACSTEIGKLSELGGTGGVIAIDGSGNVAMEFNTSGMFRGYIKSTGEKEVSIFK